MTKLALTFFFLLLLLLSFSCCCIFLFVSAQRSCALDEYDIVRGTCISGERKITYKKDYSTSCVGPDTIDLGQVEKPCVCSLGGLAHKVPAGKPNKCGPNGLIEITEFSSGGCGAGSSSATASISGKVPCACTADNIQTTFSECVNGSRRVIPYYDTLCDSAVLGAQKLSSVPVFSPCAIECEHGESLESRGVCDKCGKGTYSFNGDKYVAPYLDLPPAVTSCFVFPSSSDASSGDESDVRSCSTVSSASKLGWQPCQDLSCITTGETQGTNNIDVTMTLHLNLVSLPAFIEFEYRIESESYYDWFGVMMHEEILLWDSGMHNHYKKWRYNFTSLIPRDELCSWSLDGKVCVHPNQIAPYDPDSFFHSGVWIDGRAPAPSASYVDRQIFLFPIPLGHECDGVARFREHAAFKKMKNDGKKQHDEGIATWIFLVSTNHTPSHCEPAQRLAQISEHAAAVGADGVLFVSGVNAIRDQQKGASQHTFPRAFVIGSVTDFAAQGVHDPDSASFIHSAFHGQAVGSETAISSRLRYNSERSSGHHVELVFFYTKDGTTSAGRDRVDIRNIKVEGTKKAALKCEKADPGFYVDVAGASDQRPCPENTHSPASGASTCLTCPTGLHSGLGAQNCVPSASCGSHDFEAYRGPCHISSSTGTYRQNISYRLSPHSTCSSSAAQIASMLPPSVEVDCNTCFYGNYFDLASAKCIACTTALSVVEYDSSSRGVGCTTCPYDHVPDRRVVFSNWLLFDGVFPPKSNSSSSGAAGAAGFSRSCSSCIGGSGKSQGFDFSILTDDANYGIVPAQFQRSTVLSVGESVSPNGGIATLSYDFDLEFPGFVEFKWFLRLPKGKQLSGNDDEIKFECFVFDTTDPNRPVQIQQVSTLNIGDGNNNNNAGMNPIITTSFGISSKSKWLGPGPKKVMWRFENNNNNNNNNYKPIFVGLHSLEIRGVRDALAETCRTCPEGFQCLHTNTGKPEMCEAGTSSQSATAGAGATGYQACRSCRSGQYSSSKMRGMCQTCFEGGQVDSSQQYCEVKKGTSASSGNGDLLFIGNADHHANSGVNFLTQNPVVPVEWIQRQIGDHHSDAEHDAVYNVSWLKSVLRFPPTSRQALEISLHGGKPDLTDCLTDAQKRMTSLSFACARNPHSGEAFSLGDMLEVKPLLPSSSNGQQGGLQVKITGFPCTPENYGPSTATDIPQHMTTFLLQCDLNADHLTPILDNNEGGGTSSSQCSLVVRAKWKHACPFCTSRGIAYMDRDCSSEHSFRVRNFSWVDENGLVIPPRCYLGYRLPPAQISGCSWVGTLHPTNAHIIIAVVVSVCVFFLIVVTIIYFVQAKKQVETKYQVLRQTIGSGAGDEDPYDVDMSPAAVTTTSSAAASERDNDVFNPNIFNVGSSSAAEEGEKEKEQEGAGGGGSKKEGKRKRRKEKQQEQQQREEEKEEEVESAMENTNNNNDDKKDEGEEEERVEMPM